MATTSPRIWEGRTGASFRLRASPRVISTFRLQLTHAVDDETFASGVYYQHSGAYLATSHATHEEDIARPERRQHAAAKNAQRQRSGDAQNFRRKSTSERLFTGAGFGHPETLPVRERFGMEIIYFEACGWERSTLCRRSSQNATAKATKPSVDSGFEGSASGFLSSPAPARHQP